MAPILLAEQIFLSKRASQLNPAQRERWDEISEPSAAAQRNKGLLSRDQPARWLEPRTPTQTMNTREKGICSLLCTIVVTGP